MIRTVVHYSESTVFGGTERAILQLAAVLDRSRWQPILLHHELSPSELVDGARRSGISTRAVAPVRGKFDLVRFAALRSVIRECRPAVFHAHLHWPLACKYGIAAAAAARVAAIVASAQLHIDLNRRGFVQLQHRLLTRLIDRYIAVSHHVAAGLVGRFGVPAERVVVIPNAVDLTAFGGAAAEPPAGWPAASGRPIALVVARLEPEKRIDSAIEAAAAVPALHLVVAGAGSQRQALEALTKTLGAADRVHFLGHRTDVAAMLAHATLFVLPSSNEGLPLSVLEAMAAGVPVVATDAGGTGEVVKDGETGILVPPRDAGALAAAVRRVLADPEGAASRARAAREVVRREYSTDALVGRVTALYEALLDRQRAE